MKKGILCKGINNIVFFIIYIIIIQINFKLQFLVWYFKFIVFFLNDSKSNLFYIINKNFDFGMKVRLIYGRIYISDVFRLF